MLMTTMEEEEEEAEEEDYSPQQRVLKPISSVSPKGQRPVPIESFPVHRIMSFPKLAKRRWVITVS
jgi:hypothetical protein